ncbi:MAG: VOC family protein [Nitratireductor sp.]|nr:VOC family protein [Nitratireductor sp.]
MTAQPLAIAPILLVADLAASLDYWRDKVGFEALTFEQAPHFAIVKRGGARLMLQEVAPGTAITPNWKLHEKTSNAFVWIDDAKALYEELIERGANIDWELYEAPYGALEFGIQDLDDHDIAFSQLLD